MTATRRLYARVGALILVALALGIGFIIFLTSGRSGGDNTIYETYLQESVQGLEVGAPVRYRGVRVGRVTEISLVAVAYPPRNSQAMPQAYQRVLVRFGIDRSRVGEFTDIEQGIQQGLRVRLSSQGITGVAYLELDFADPDRFPVPKFPWESRYPIMPSTPSTVAQVQNAAENILRRIEAAPLEELLANVMGLVTDIRNQVKPEGDAAQTMREAGQTLALLRDQLEKANLPGLSADARALIGGPDTQAMLKNTAAAAAELRTGLSRLPAAINSLEQAVRAARVATTDVNADLTPILRDLRTTAANLRDVTETMRRSPSQTIFGAPPPAPSQR